MGPRLDQVQAKPVDDAAEPSPAASSSALTSQATVALEERIRQAARDAAAADTANDTPPTVDEVPKSRPRQDSGESSVGAAPNTETPSERDVDPAATPPAADIGGDDADLAEPDADAATGTIEASNVDAVAADSPSEAIEPQVGDVAEPEPAPPAPGPELAAWKAKVASGAAAIKAPTLPAGAAAPPAVAARSKKLTASRAPRRKAIAKEAAAAVTPAPIPPQPRPIPPPGPVPSASALVEAESKHKLASVRMPDLTKTPRGTQPLIRDPRAQAAAAATEANPATAKAPGAPNAAAPKPTAKDAAAVKNLDGTVADGPGKAEAGSAEGIEITDKPPPVRTALPPQIGNIMRTVVAKLLANTKEQAKPIVTAARDLAYPNKVLSSVYKDIGADGADRIADALATSLKLIATDAGIAAKDLDAAVKAEQAEVTTEADKAAGAVTTAGTEQSKQLSTDGGAEVGEVKNEEEAQKKHAAAVVQASAAEGSPAAIDARASEQIRLLNRRAADLRFDYGQAKDRRHKALDQATLQQYRAYTEAGDKDKKVIDDEVEGPATVTENLEKAGIAIWLNTRKQTLGKQVGELKKEATAEATKYRKAVTTASSDANEKIRDWADAEKGETRSWWEELFYQFRDWSQQAEVESSNWSVVRASEARDATVQNMGLLSGFVASQGEAINLETNAAFKQLSKEQQAVIKAYYASPPTKRDSLGAVAAGLKFRLANEQRPKLIESMKREVLAKPTSEARNLEQIGKAQTDSFSAQTIADRLYDAMFGGVTGWGTDEEKIYRNLTGLTPLQGKAVRATYAMDHGGNLDKALASELDGDNALIRAKAALEGDPVMEAVGALNEAMAGWGTDEDTIMKMLRGKSAEQRKRIIEEYKRQYGKDLRSALDSEMDDHDQDRSYALLDGDTAKADAIALDQAMHGGFLGWGTDEAQIESVYGDIRGDVAKQQVSDGKGGMRLMTQAEMEAEVLKRNRGVERAYNTEYGSPGDQESALRAAYKSELSGPTKDLVFALADNDLVAADAARLEREKRGFYADDDVINGVLEDQYKRSLDGLKRDPARQEQRRKLQERAAKKGWSPYQLAAAERDLDRQMENDARAGAARNMAALEEKYDTKYSRWGKGGMQSLITYNMSGTDQEKARRLVKQGGYLTPAQRIDYATRGAGTDEDDFTTAVAGRTKAEIAAINAELKKMGRPTVQQLSATELSGRDRFDMDIRLQGVPENEKQELSQARQRTNWELRNSPVQGHARQVLTKRMAEMEDQYRLINDPNADPFERKRALNQFRSRAVGVESGVENYRAQVDAVTDAVATAAALTVAIVVTVATGGVAGAVLGALAAAATTMTVKAGLKGAAYGVEDMAVDAVVGVVDAAAAFATAGIGSALLRVAKSGGGRASRLAGSRLAATLSRAATSGSRTQRMIAHGAAEFVEGAAGALPSALAGNMLNDKNWEGNALANIVGGTLVETGMGGVMGGAMGSAGGFKAPKVDLPAPKVGDILAHRGSPVDRLTAWKTHKASNPDADMKGFLQQFDDQLATRLAAESADASVQRALRTELLAGIPPRQRAEFAGTRIEIVSDADFRKFTGSKSGNAVTVIENGQPKILLRDGAPPSVLREEGIHLQQIADPDLGRLARQLDEGRLKNWDALPLGEKMELYAIKVELEIDAQKKLIDGLDIDIRRGGPDDMVAGLQRQHDIAEDSLRNLQKRAAEVGDVGPLERIAMSRGMLDPPPYLDQPARLFNKVKQTEVVTVTRLPTPEVKSLKLTKNAEINLTVDGKPVQLKMTKKGLQYVGPPGPGPVPKPTSFSDDLGGVADFQYLGGRRINVTRTYRTVEVSVKGSDGSWTTRTRNETRPISHSSLKQGSDRAMSNGDNPADWVQRGSDSVRKGREAEIVSDRISKLNVDDPASDVIATFKVQRANGTGFDGVEVRIDTDDKPVLTIIEVKDTPGWYSSYETFSAVSTRPKLDAQGMPQGQRGTLENNLRDLSEKLTPGRKDLIEARSRAYEADGPTSWDDIADMQDLGIVDFHRSRGADFEGVVNAELDAIMANRLGISVDAYRQAKLALDAGRFELQIRLTPTTDIGFSGANNMFDRIRKDWEGLLSKGVIKDLRDQSAVTMVPHYLDEVRAANKALLDIDPSGRLGFSGLSEAPYLDSSGNLLAVQRVRDADLGINVDSLALALADRVATRTVLPTGRHANTRMVVDLTDIAGDKAQVQAQIEELIRIRLKARGASPKAANRVNFIPHRN